MRTAIGPALLAATGLVLAACGDPRMRAATELVDLAKDAPFVIAATRNAPHPIAFHVRDDALKRFNSVFAVIDAGGPERGAAYEALPAELLIRLPISQIISSAMRYRGSDTLVASFAFLRPDTTLYSAVLKGLPNYNDSTTIDDARIKMLNESFAKARLELQQPDTVFVWVTRGPHIVRYQTATEIRDSIRYHELTIAARPVVVGLIRSAQFGASEIEDYSDLAPARADLGDPDIGGGSVKGLVVAGTPGWYHVPGLSIAYEVQCRLGHDDSHSHEVAYLEMDRVTTGMPKTYLCMWSGAGAHEWRAAWRRGIDARVIASFGPDSVVGEWHSLRR